MTERRSKGGTTGPYLCVSSDGQDGSKVVWVLWIDNSLIISNWGLFSVEDRELDRCRDCLGSKLFQVGGVYVT